jgi:group I intron endonuclease
MLLNECKLYQKAKVAGVYAFKNTINNKHYVGSACYRKRRSVAVRLKEHLRNLRRGTHTNPHLQSAWIKYGEIAFELHLLEEVQNETILHDKEEFWMKELNSIEHGYNISSDTVAFMRGIKFSQEHCAKISLATKKRMEDSVCRQQIGQRSKALWKTLEYRNQIVSKLCGQKRSEESCNRISEAKKGKPNYKLRGKKHSEETIRHISEAKKGKPNYKLRGRPISNTTKIALSKTHTGNKYCVGRILSQETKNKIGNANRGRKHTNDAKLKMRLRPPLAGAYKGVSHNKKTNKLKAALKNNDKELFLGWFDNAILAAENYDYYAIKVYGKEKCYINFPEKDYTNYVPKRKV